MALGIYSGKDALLNGIACVQSWSLTEALAQTRYAASCVPNATNMPKGISNWTGNVTGIGAYPSAAIPVATTFVFKGVTNNDAGQGDLLSVDGVGLFEQLTININKETGAPIGWEATFGLQGVPTESATGAADATLASPEHGDALDVKIGGASVESVSVAVKSAQIILRRPHTTYPKLGSTYRAAGNLEADINFAVSSPKLFNAAWATNGLAVVRIMTGATSYWEFSKIRFGAKTGFVVNRNPPAIVGFTVPGFWNGADAGVAGFITYYDGAAANDVYGDSTP
jgi:hypothetical protein